MNLIWKSKYYPDLSYIAGRLDTGSLSFAALILVFIGVAYTNPTGRLYIKFNGEVAAAMDDAGHFYSRGIAEYGVDTSYPGLLFKKDDEVQFAILRAEEGNPEQLGKVFTGGGYYWEDQSIPYEPFGTLVFEESHGYGMIEMDDFDHSLNMASTLVSKFGYRKNAALIQSVERGNFIDAILWSDAVYYPTTSQDSSTWAPDYIHGLSYCYSTAETCPKCLCLASPWAPSYVGGVSYWDKQDQLHRTYFEQRDSGRFLPWHREFLNQFEDTLRLFDPLVSLPYWDWTTNPTVPNALATDTLPLLKNFIGWMGDDSTGPMGNIGNPFSGLTNDNNLFGSRDSIVADGKGHPASPPQRLTRGVDTAFLPTSCDNRATLAQSDFLEFSDSLEILLLNHVYSSLGGTIQNYTMAAEDPFFLLIHSNMDRLWTTWQKRVNHGERLDTATAYGRYSGSLTGTLKPWDDCCVHVRPWAAPENQQIIKAYKDPSVVSPRLYDDP